MDTARNRSAFCFVVVSFLSVSVASAQGQRGPQIVSPSVADGQATFRLQAPDAKKVELRGSDIPGLRGAELKKGDEGIWEITMPIAPGYYRYNFNVDGVTVIDPRNPAASQSVGNVSSLVGMPGNEWMDTLNVPHGAVSEITYFSTALNRFRRMHVYTPPGYQKNNNDYPVFYLLHGAGDSDDSWTSVGRAGFILDNLIDAGKAKPMVAVMPAGHAGPFRFGRSGPDEFAQDFVTDLMPYIEKNFRVKTDRDSRAMAGLSMGGGQTLNLGMSHLDKFGYLGVFSSGAFGIVRRPNDPPPEGPSYEERHNEVLSNPDLRKGLKLFWFATGKDDFVIEATRATVAMFKKHDFDVVFEETEGGHTWIKWREYLNKFAPMLFQ